LVGPRIGEFAGMESIAEIESGEAIVKRLSRPSLIHWLALVAIDWAMIVGIFVACFHFWNPLVLGLGVLLIGTRQQAIGVLGHEGVHYRICKPRALSDFLSNFFCFLPLGFDLEVYRRFHLRHHLHTSMPDDPELVLKSAAAPMYDQPTPLRRVFTSFFTALLGAGIPELYRFIRKMPPQTSREVLSVLAWHAAAIGCLWATGQLWVVGVWWLAYCTSYWAVFRVRVWTEHHGTDDTNRTHFNWLERFLFVPNGIGYHYEHHRWPSITCWNLPEARRLFDPHVPLIPMGRLLRSYAALPALRSGAVRRQSPSHGSAGTSADVSVRHAVCAKTPKNELAGYCDGSAEPDALLQ
jgi:fatty acid desaturase